MKIYLTYGFVAALCNTLLAVVLFFLGLHSDPEKLSTAQWIGWIGGLIISIAGIVLGTKARRAERSANEPFTYGQALGAGVMIALFAALFGAIGHFLYMSMINPGMTEIVIQSQIAQLEASGMSSSQIESAESITRKMMHPAIQAAFAFIFGFIFNAVIALIASAFLKRSEVPPLPHGA